MNYTIRTHRGTCFNIGEISVEDIHIEDIAHSLSKQCRFNGNTRTFYSVAQHSMILSGLVGEEFRLMALMHDAAEAYLGDIIYPIKRLFPSIEELEEKVLKVIKERFSITHTDEQWDSLMLCDRRIALNEAHALIDESITPKEYETDRPLNDTNGSLKKSIQFELSIEEARESFIKYFVKYGGK